MTSAVAGAAPAAAATSASSISSTAKEGDWSIHCHKSHHTMNAMGHGVPTMIGVELRDLAQRITQLVPDYMAMGSKGMHEMAEMEMPLPENTAPMMATINTLPMIAYSQ